MTSRAFKALLLTGAALAAASGSAFAQSTPPPKLDSGDTAWMLTSTALVLMMTIPGLALFYGGMVRKKNVLATVMQSFAVCCLVTVLWMVIGYSLAFTDGGSLNAYIGGLSKMFLAGIGKDTLQGTIPESVFMTFQMTFAIITPALICGAFADRMKFSSLLVFLSLWLVVVYAPVCHWVWGGGFLAKDGVLDFAGGTVVHINSGIAGLVCALVLGRRAGHGSENMAPHNLVLTVIGALAAVGRLVRLQRGLGGRRQRRSGHGHGRDADRDGGCGTVVDVRGVDGASPPERARHRFRRGCRSGCDHAGLRLRRPERRADHRLRRRRGVLLRGDDGEAHARL